MVGTITSMTWTMAVVAVAVLHFYHLYHHHCHHHCHPSYLPLYPQQQSTNHPSNHLSKQQFRLYQPWSQNPSLIQFKILLQRITLERGWKIRFWKWFKWNFGVVFGSRCFHLWGIRFMILCIFFYLYILPWRGQQQHQRQRHKFQMSEVETACQTW